MGFMCLGLLEAKASVTINGDVIIGRGIPDDWLIEGQPIERKNIRLNDGKMLIRLSIENASAGIIDNERGTVTCDGSTRELVVTLNKNASQRIFKPLVQVQLQSTEQLRDNDIDLKWETVDGADSYIVKISDRREFMVGSDAQSFIIWNDAIPYVTYRCMVTTIRGEESDVKDVTIKLPNRENGAVSAVLTASELRPRTLDLTRVR